MKNRLSIKDQANQFKKTPSSDAWDRISSRLEHSNQKKYSFAGILSKAAILILLLASLVAIVYNINSTETSRNNPEEFVYQVDQLNEPNKQDGIYNPNNIAILKDAYNKHKKG